VRRTLAQIQDAFAAAPRRSLVAAVTSHLTPSRPAANVALGRDGRDGVKLFFGDAPMNARAAIRARSTAQPMTARSGACAQPVKGV